MKIDFFNNNCNEDSLNESEFGICDDEDGRRAYTDITDRNKWIAHVSNINKKDVIFTAIDNCVVIKKTGTNDNESNCDGMLRYNDSLYLVELKNKRSNWKTDAINQLLNTIKLLKINHDLNIFKHKKAFASNRKHPQFAVISSEQKMKFYRESDGFIIDINSKIIIK